MQLPLVAAPSFVAFLISIVSCTLAWRRRHRSPAAVHVVIMQLGVMEWSLAVGTGGLFTLQAVQTAFALAIFPGVAAVVVGFFCFASCIADAAYRPTRRVVGLMLIEPVLLTLAAATNHFHHLIFTSAVMVGTPPLAAQTVGPLYWVHAFVSYGFVMLGITRLVRARRHGSTLHRRQITLTLAVSCLPIIASAVTLARFSRGSSIDLTVLTFALGGALFLYALSDRLLSVVPLARSLVMDRVSDAVLVTDIEHRVVDANSSAVRLVGHLTSDPSPTVGALLGRTLADLVPGMHTDAEHQDSGSGDTWPGDTWPGPSGEHAILLPSGRLDLDVRGTPLIDGRGSPLGHVYVIRDITQLNEQRRELEATMRTIEALQIELAEQAIRDDLTGLHNRRHLNTRLTEQIRRAGVPDAVGSAAGRSAAGRSAAVFSVMLLDVDHFKRVNDDHGHGVGDDLLKAMARTLSHAVRRDDVVARYGGEEFVVVFAGTDAREAMARAEVIRRSCAAARIPVGDGWVSATISAGVAEYHTGGISELLQDADRALYRAKAAGRDRVLLASGAPSTS